MAEMPEIKIKGVPELVSRLHGQNEKLKQERNAMLVSLRAIAVKVNRGEARPLCCTWQENQMWDILESVFRRNGQ